MTFGLLLLAATAIRARRSTEVGLGLLVAIRLLLLGSDWLHARRNAHVVSPNFPRFFNDSSPLMLLSSVLMVALAMSLALQIRRSAGRVILCSVVVAGIGYAIATFFGPTQWNPQLSGPMALTDAAGYAQLLITDILLGGLLLSAIFQIERQAREHRFPSPVVGA